jgi:micrococcal nuclease
LRAAISAICVAFSVTVLLFSSYNYNFALGQGQQQFQDYQNPTLGISIQYPSDWELLEESNDKLRFIKQEGFVTADLNVENLDQSDVTLAEYTNTRVNELRTQRPSFQLLSSEPTIISNDIPAQKVVYTFEREEDGKTNKVIRIWSINEDKLYTLAYIAESSQYDRHLPTFQRMADSFVIEAGGSEDDNERSSPPSPGGNCDRISYPDPDVCIPPFPPDLNCDDVTYKNFKVTGSDPHRFDGDKDGLGCETADGGGVRPPDNGNRNCDPSYPTVCIKSPPPDLNCPDIPHKNFQVTGSDPHRFDRDNDGIGCESAEGVTPPEPPEPPECQEGFALGANGRCIPICDEDTPPNMTCHDEGDPTDPPEPPACTYDGPCPPCPEGVEAAWCADEDERGDFDCGDPDIENDPRCKDGEPVTEEGEEDEGNETTPEGEESGESVGSSDSDSGSSGSESSGSGEENPDVIVD